MDSTLALARSVVAAVTVHEREAKLLQVMPAFREMVSTTVGYMLAGEICGLATKEDRSAALAEVPAAMRAQVESLVRMRFAAARELHERTTQHLGGMQ